MKQRNLTLTILLTLSVFSLTSCKEKLNQEQKQIALEYPIEEKKFENPSTLFSVRGNAELIVYWSASNDKNTNRAINSNDEISITVHQNQITTSLIHKNKKIELSTIYEEEVILDSTLEVEVYGYDFDKDGQQEIVIISSAEFSMVDIKVFRYLNDFTEMVGFFGGQFGVIFEDNTLTLPYGGQGLYNEYIYKDGSFYELIYHNPND